MKNGYYISLFLFCSFLATAQKVDFEFYNATNGLSGNHTSNVVQDDQGFMWVVNDYKLHRFDGRNFVRYPLSPQNVAVSLKRLKGIDVYEDSLLLLLTETEVFLMNPRTDTWLSIPMPFAQNNMEDFSFKKVITKTRIGFWYIRRVIKIMTFGVFAIADLNEPRR